MNASAGRVLILPKGEYNPATTYNMLDMVRYQNGLFVCKQTSTGTAPSFDSDTDYWQLLVSGSDVTGVKGDSEATYREGNVNITKADIGLGNVDNTSDADKPVSTAQQTALDGKLGTSGASTNTTVAYTTKDAAKTTTEKTNSTTDQPSTVEKLTSGETLATMFGKISAMFKNIRRLWNTVGTTAIDTAYGATLTAQMANLKSYNTYSTSETWTGKYWTDGKKIYKKVFTGLNITAQKDSTYPFFAIDGVQLRVGNVSELLNMTGKGQSGTDKYCIPIAARMTSATSSQITCNLRVNVGWAINTIIVEYTKTT